MRHVVGAILQFVILTLAILFLLCSMVQNFRIVGTSMEPNTHNGQYIMVNKTSYWFGRTPQRGDVIVFRPPEAPQTTRVKRVVALPGETIEIRANGIVYVDGCQLEEQYLPAYHIGSVGSWTVPSGQYFVMGDNRSVSYDSCQAGTIPLRNVIGKAWLVVWPASDWGFAPNYVPAVEAMVK